MRVLEKTKY